MTPSGPIAELKAGEVHYCRRGHVLISYRVPNGDPVRCPLCAALRKIAKLEAQEGKAQG